jgi:hypothetical protein
MSGEATGPPTLSLCEQLLGQQQQQHSSACCMQSQAGIVLSVGGQVHRFRGWRGTERMHSVRWRRRYELTHSVCNRHGYVAHRLCATSAALVHSRLESSCTSAAASRFKCVACRFAVLV